MMSREIKFRAWYKDEEKIYEVKALSFSDGEIYAVELWSPEGTLDGKWHEYSVYLRDVELMQYTGLKDCKGQEIYEGDILRVDEDSFGVVKWGVGCFYFEDDIDGRTALEDTYVDRYAVVLGNIYEHPELLRDNPASPDGPELPLPRPSSDTHTEH